MRARDPVKELAIRENALKMFFERGFDGFSMQKLARASGVSPGTLYIYYKDRDDLILQLYREEMEKLTEAALAGFDPAMSFAEGLRVQWMNRANYYLKHPIESHFLEQIRFTPFHDEAMRCGGSSFSEAMRAFVRGAIQRGELAPMPVEIYWSIAYAPLYQLLKFHLHGHSFAGMGKFVFDQKKMLATLELVLRALRPEGKQ